MGAIILAAVCTLWTCKVSSTLVVDHTRLLSTEKARATLTIVNSSPERVYFDWYGLTYHLLDGSGRVEQVQYRGMPVATPIAPGARYVRSIDLPACPVHSDPCAQNVMVRYAVYQDHVPLWFEKRLPRYDFIPDPTATYEIEGLRENRPVFITPGIARETVTPENMRVDFTASQSEPRPPFTTTPPLVADLAQALRKKGIAPASTGYSIDGSKWRAQLFIDAASSRFNEIVQALQPMAEQFGGRITAFSPQFVLNFDTNTQNLDNEAYDQAQKKAQDVAAMMHAGEIDGPSSNGRSFPRLYAGNQATADSVPNFAHGASIFDRTLDLGSDSGPTPIAAAVEGVYTSNAPARLEVDPIIARGAAKAFRPPDSWLLPTFDPQLRMAADRPELYVIGTASVKAALETRLFPEFIATLDARQRTQYLATLLGVIPGAQSLFAVYPAAETADLYSVGLATTFSGTGLAPTQPFKADSQILAFRSDDAQQRPMLPIAVPNDDAIITEVAGATPISQPDALRFDVQLFYDAPTGEDVTATNADAVSKRLRMLPFVIDVAATTQQRLVRPGVAYELIVRGAKPADLVQVLGTLQSIYAPLHPDVTSRIFGIAFNCSTLEHRMLSASVRQSVLQAKADAATMHRRLRKLLLAAVYPLDGQEVCSLRAKASDDLQYSPPNTLPQLPRKVRIFVDSLLVFRTW